MSSIQQRGGSVSDEPKTTNVPATTGTNKRRRVRSWAFLFRGLAIICFLFFRVWCVPSTISVLRRWAGEYWVVTGQLALAVENGVIFRQTHWLFPGWAMRSLARCRSRGSSPRGRRSCFEFEYSWWSLVRAGASFCTLGRTGSRAARDENTGIKTSPYFLFDKFSLYRDKTKISALKSSYDNNIRLQISMD
jgi:hypothetical protein